MEFADQQQYLEILPSQEKELLKNLLKNMASSGNVKCYHDQLQQLLLMKPYPILQILTLNYNKAKFYIGRIVETALTFLLINYENTTTYSAHFINFLANFPMQILTDTLIQQKLFENLIKPKSEQIEVNIYLALLARNDNQLLARLQKKLQQTWETGNQCLLSKELILHQALQRQKHFVPLICKQLNDFNQIADVGIRNNLLILKLVQEFSIGAQTTLAELSYISKILAAVDIENTPEDLHEIHLYFCADLHRLSLMTDFLRTQKEVSKRMRVDSLLKTTSVLELFYKQNIDVSYEETLHLIEAIYRWLQQVPALYSTRDQEVETFTYYTVLSNVYDIIANQAKAQFKIQRLQQLISLLRQIRNLSTLCDLIEDIFQMIFLRWEQLQKNNSNESRKSKKTCNFLSTDDEDDNYNDDAPVADTFSITPTATATHVRRHGFICRSSEIYSIYSYLKNFVTKKLHTEDYKRSTEHIQLRFQRIIDVINETLLKYTVLEKIHETWRKQTGDLKPQSLAPEELLFLVQLHTNIKNKCSSDDENLEKQNYISLTRRKIRKRRRSSFVEVTVLRKYHPTLEESCVPTNSSIVDAETEKHISEEMYKYNVTPRLNETSIIPKMLVTPENLAIMALALNDFNAVKHVIETFQLSDDTLNRDLLFVEQEQQVKQKLTSIYANYLAQESQSSNSNAHNNNSKESLVEQIKNVAVKGFEMSKIISIVDNFAQTQKIQQSNELQELLQKYVHNSQYSFLQQYEVKNLNAIIIADLIINLSFNREIASNLLMIIKLQHRVNKSDSYSNSNFDIKQATQVAHEKSHLPLEIGAMILIENLCECMRLLEPNNKSSLNKLLCDNFYSLKPHKLSIQLQREALFKAIYYIEPAQFGTCGDLKAHLPLFQQVANKHNYYARFCTYMTHLAHLLQLRDPNLVYHTNELLKHDPYHVVGELIYECNMAPLEIEANVNALNLNLVHVIALNICPEVAGRMLSVDWSLVAEQKQATIFNYITQHNKLLSYILRGIQSSGECLQSNVDMRADYLLEFMELDELAVLATMYNGNKMIVTLCSDSLSRQALERLKNRALQLEVLLYYKNKQAIQQVQLHKNIDCLITELIHIDNKNIKLAAYIHDIGLRGQLLHQNFTKISTTKMAKELIECTLQHKDAQRCISTQLRLDLENTLSDITTYAQVSELLQFETWPQAYDFGRKSPNAIFEKLLQLQLYELCYKWCLVVNLTERFAQQPDAFMAKFLDALLELEDEVDPYLLKMLELFPTSAYVNFLDIHKEKFRSISLLTYTIDYLEHHVHQSFCYVNYRMSLEIFKILPLTERDYFWPLLRYPLLIIEQLIMNAKFEILTNILTVVRAALKQECNTINTSGRLCNYCFDKRGHVYDMHNKSLPHKTHFQLGQNVGGGLSNSAFILLNFNLYQKDHIITNECIDLLLRIYATKALDYHILDNSMEKASTSTDEQMSMDSLCGTFKMPKRAPSREDWVRDEEATYCMCCRRTKFTMLMRRHHCRRCGRVVCFTCSTRRMRLPELYQEVEVRICNDCHLQNNKDMQRKETNNSDESEIDNVLERILRKQRIVYTYKWRLSGNITHDKLLREEFCYEHAPSVALSLSILTYHSNQQKCVDLLLYHCRKMEKLIVPNPEVDYELVAKMMNCLAVAAKVRGASADVETIREHSEIIMSVVQSGCEALIPSGPLNNHSLRKLADSLVQTEHWSLALEVHLKYGFATAGVMAAHGLACLRAGCYDTAREKFAHCMTPYTTDRINSLLYKHIFNLSDKNDNAILDKKVEAEVPRVKRSKRGPPLLQEILKLLTILPCVKTQPEALQRASVIRNSNSSLVSLFSKRKESYVVASLHEPALNVLNSLAKLKHITKGIYTEGHLSESQYTTQKRQSHTQNFVECMHYVLSYGSHADILTFLMQQQELLASLKYYLVQQLETDHFIQSIFLTCLRTGQLAELIEYMKALDDNQISVWRLPLIQTCAYLEKQKYLNSLYQLQLLLKDTIRASMTCVRFYSMNCENFQELHANSQHLRNAYYHLQTELELTHWENINVGAMRSKYRYSFSNRRASNVSTVTSSTSLAASFVIQMDTRTLNGHINTILRQLEVSKFLADCEAKQSTQESLITLNILKQIRFETQRSTLPTLFDSAQDKIQLCILILLCGTNIDEGFGLTYRIIQDYKLMPLKIFGATTKFLARNQRLTDIGKLLNCITSNNGTSTRDIDELLSIAVNSAINTHEPEVKTVLDNLAKKINNIELRISCYIFIGQLKSAYLLANKYERVTDIRKILRQAELTNQLHIKKLCEKKLNINTTQTVPL